MSRYDLMPQNPADTDPFGEDARERQELDTAREQRWIDFEQECRAFAIAEPDGFAAVLRAVSRAMTGQRELF
jgi:hypothetical protein